MLKLSAPAYEVHISQLIRYVKVRLHDQSFRQLVFDGNFAQRKLYQSYPVYPIRLLYYYQGVKIYDDKIEVANFGIEFCGNIKN